MTQQRYAFCVSDLTASIFFSVLLDCYGILILNTIDHVRLLNWVAVVDASCLAMLLQSYHHNSVMVVCFINGEVLVVLSSRTNSRD